MKYYFTKLRSHLRRGGALLVVFGLTALVLAYLMGVYDVSFLDRESLLGTSGSSGTAADTLQTETETLPPETETVPPDTADGETETETAVISGSTGTVTIQKESRSVTDITNPALLSDRVKNGIPSGSSPFR